VPDFVHDEIVPQFDAVIVTVPPLDGTEVGDADTVHTGLELVEQLIVMLPCESTSGDWQLLAAVPLTVTVNPRDGVGAKANVDETATARTRVRGRYMYIGLPRKAAANGHHGALQNLRHCVEKFVMDFVSPKHRRRSEMHRRQTVISALPAALGGHLVALFTARCKKRAGLCGPALDHIVRKSVTNITTYWLVSGSEKSTKRVPL
jgi:hypothetical protein